MTDRIFTCEMCKGTFTSEWTEEEAREEAVERFGSLSDPETDARVCDDCYNLIMEDVERRYEVDD